MRNDRSKCGQWTGHVPGHAERDRLVATLGAVLRALRTEYGLGTRPLARRSTVARSTIQRLEAGERRPRRSILAALAYGFDPDRAEQLAAMLCEAAGPSLREDTTGGLRMRERRKDDALRAVTREVWRIWQAAEASKREAFRLSTVVLAKLPLDPMKPSMTNAELDRGFVRLQALHGVMATSRELFNRRDALVAALSRPRHPLEVKILG